MTDCALEFLYECYEGYINSIYPQIISTNNAPDFKESKSISVGTVTMELKPYMFNILG